MIPESISNLLGIFWLLVSTVLLLSVYHFVIKDWNFFSKNNVKFVRGLPIFGAHYKTHLLSLPLVESFQEIYNKFPNERFIGLYEIGGKPFYLIRDPELIKQVGIKDFDHFSNHLINAEPESDPLLHKALFAMRDQRWRDMRSILTVAFTGSKMRAMSNLLVEVANTFCTELKNEIKDQTVECDMKDLFQRYATDAIASCAFGITVNSMKDRNNEFHKTGLKISKFGVKFFFYGLIPKIMNLLRVRIFDEKSTDYFRELIKNNMAYRQNHNIVRPDMINILLEAKKETVTNGDVSNNGNNKSHDTETAKWDDDELIAQSISFFLAGFKTASLVLGFATQELVLNEKIYKKLRAEVDEYRQQLDGKPATYEIINKMKYLDMVVSEILRRRAGFFTDRVVTKPYELENWDGTKVKLNIGDAIYLPSYALHNDPQYFPDPTTFDPERFNDENKNNIRSGVYFPFGIGPRVCIASRFALMEFKSILFHLFSEFDVEKSSKTMDPVFLNPYIAEPKDGFWVNIKVRK